MQKIEFDHINEAQENDVIFWKGQHRYRTDAVTGEKLFKAWACDFSILDFSRSGKLLSDGITDGSIVEIPL